MTRVLLVDRSGRGHAFADLFARTGSGIEVHYAPGCARAAGDGIVPQPHLGLDDPDPMVRHALAHAVDLVFVANTYALADGFVDAFRLAGLPVIGPDAAAARLEGSKSYAKALFERYGIPTPVHRVFDDVESARRYVRAARDPQVVKADGLCGGNGAFVCDGAEAALDALDRLMVRRIFGAAGDRVLVERRVEGPELSLFALTDGRDFLLLPTALDYPKSDDGGRGITCAGMGSVCPHPGIDHDLLAAAEERLLRPLMRLVQGEGLSYTGILYLGAIVVDGQPQLLEVNARMGDPEAEVVLPLLEGDFTALCEAILERRLAAETLSVAPGAACDVVLTQGPTASSPGWPYGDHDRGHSISGLEAVDGDRCRVFLGEAKELPGGELVTDGGRVAHVVGFGDDLDEAVAAAYENVPHIRFEGMRYRSDIGGPPP